MPTTSEKQEHLAGASLHPDREPAFEAWRYVDRFVEERCRTIRVALERIRRGHPPPLGFAERCGEIEAEAEALRLPELILGRALSALSVEDFPRACFHALSSLGVSARHRLSPQARALAQALPAPDFVPEAARRVVGAGPCDEPLRKALALRVLQSRMLPRGADLRLPGGGRADEPDDGEVWQ